VFCEGSRANAWQGVTMKPGQYLSLKISFGKLGVENATNTFEGSPMENPHNGLISNTKLGHQGVHCSKEWDKAWVKIHDNILT
jgi:hypothetical protein